MARFQLLASLFFLHFSICYLMADDVWRFRPALASNICAQRSALARFASSMKKREEERRKRISSSTVHMVASWYLERLYLSTL